MQDLKRKIEKIKKTQRQTTLEIETLGKKSGTIDANITNKQVEFLKEKQEDTSNR